MMRVTPSLGELRFTSSIAAAVLAAGDPGLIEVESLMAGESANAIREAQLDFYAQLITQVGNHENVTFTPIFKRTSNAALDGLIESLACDCHKAVENGASLKIKVQWV